MIRKTILFFFLFSIAYSLFIACVEPARWHTGQYTEQRSIVKVQKFIYNEKKTYTGIIVGSSISDRIPPDSLGNIYNLAIVGRSIYDGFKILKNTGYKPKMIFVEMNEVFRREDKEFTSSIFSPVNYYPKKEIFALRDDKQPIGILTQSIINDIYRLKNKLRGSIPPVGSVYNLNADTNHTKIIPPDNIIGIQYPIYNKVPAIKDIDYSVNQLRAYVKYFKDNGVQICFFEVPIDNRLENTPLSNAIRKTFYADFPPSQYNYLPEPNWKQCETVDGIHLSEHEAMGYNLFFRKQVKNLKK